MTTITTTSPSTASIIHTLGPCRRLQFEMKDLSQQLDQVASKDPLTLALRQWVAEFTLALRGKEESHILLDTYVKRLQDLLIDPLTNEVIEDLAVLGVSDGVTYGYKAWKIREACLLSEVEDIAYLKEVLAPEFIEPLLMLSREEKVQCSRRSPLNPTDPTFFMVQEHLAISPMLKWLASYDKRPSTHKLDAAYEWLTSHSHIVIRDFYSEKTEQVFTELAKIHHLLDVGFTDSTCRTVQYFAMRWQDAERILEATQQLLAVISSSDRDQLLLQVEQMHVKMDTFKKLIEQEMSPTLATALIRRLTVELKDIGQELEGSILQDETTNNLRKWHESFVRCLRSSQDVGQVLARHIGIVHDILTDPLTNQVVGDNPVLGSDGVLYGPKALANRRAFLLADDQDIEKLKAIIAPAALAALVKTDRKERVICSDLSPLDENNPTFFTVQPHPIVPMILQWLANHNARPSSQPTDRIYQWLMDHLPHRMKQSEMHAPRSVEARMALRREKVAEQRRRVEVVDANFQRELMKLERFVEVTVPATLAKIQAECEEKLEALTLRHYHGVALIEQAEKQVYQALAAEVVWLVQEVTKLESQLDTIKGSCQTMEGELDTLRAEQEKTRHQLNAIAWEIKRRKKRKRLETIRTVCYVASAIVVNCILPEGAGVGFKQGRFHIGIAV